MRHYKTASFKRWWIRSGAVFGHGRTDLTETLRRAISCNAYRAGYEAGVKAERNAPNGDG